MNYYLINLILSIIFLLKLSSVNSQEMQRIEYCKCATAQRLQNDTQFPADTFLAIYKEDSIKIAITIVNTTTDTQYLFNSYFQNNIVGSKFLHRIDPENNYKISFLPLVPFLSTSYSHLITDNVVLGHHQVVYDFIKFPPRSSQTLDFYFEDLFKNKNCKRNAIMDFDVKTLHKYSRKIPIRYRTTDKLKGNYQLRLEFAVYNAVDVICSKTAFYYQEYLFDKQSKEFSILSVPIHLKSFKHTLFND